MLLSSCLVSWCCFFRDFHRRVVVVLAANGAVFGQFRIVANLRACSICLFQDMEGLLSFREMYPCSFALKPPTRTTWSIASTCERNIRVIATNTAVWNSEKDLVTLSRHLDELVKLCVRPDPPKAKPAHNTFTASYLGFGSRPPVTIDKQPRRMRDVSRLWHRSIPATSIFRITLQQCATSSSHRSSRAQSMRSLK